MLIVRDIIAIIEVIWFKNKTSQFPKGSFPNIV